MSYAWLIMRRELASYLRTPVGYVVGGVVLLIDGLFFNAFAVESRPKPSAEVLEAFFYFASGTTMVAAILLSMRLIAEERQRGSLVLLMASPAREADIVFGKFVASLLFLIFIIALTAYMPALVFIRGKVAIGHILCGYLGLVLLGGTALAIGLLGSSLTGNPLIAGVLSAAMLVVLLLGWLLAQISEPPASDWLRYAALWQSHFQPFQQGILQWRSVVYLLSLIYLSLTAAALALKGERWQ